MPRSKTGAKRPRISTDDLTLAVKLVITDGLSVRAAAKQCSVSRTTLQRHIDSHKKSEDDAFRYRNNCSLWQVFSKEEELSLTEYLLTASSMHYGLSKEDVKKLAYKYAKANGKRYPSSWDNNEQAGEQWLTDFRKRNSELSLRKPRPTSIARSIGFNKPVVEKFFLKYSSVLEKYKFGPERIYNMDETGVSSVHTPPKVIASKKLKQIGGITSTERGFTTTMIGCINAVGNSVPPFFVFPRVNFQDNMLHGAPPGSSGACHPSGWTTGNIFLKFLEHFVKHVKPETDNKVLLIMDNHESHISIEAIDMARKNGIVMLTIPPHTSHKLQPLDKGVYGPFKTYLNNSYKNWHLTNPGKTIKVYDIASISGKAYPLAFTPSNIMSGFSSSGLWPINPDIFLQHEFCPSSVSDKPLPDKSAESPAGPSNVSLPTQGDKSSPARNSPELDNAAQTPNSFINVESSNFCSPTEADASIWSSRKSLSLEEIRPFPKAEGRKETRKGRKPGKSRVLTDTPEKKAIEEEMKNKKKKQPRKNINTKLFKKGEVSVEKKKTIKKRKNSDSESDSSFASFMSDESGINIEDFIRKNEEELMESEEREDSFAETPLKIDRWVLVKFPTKTTVKHYIGQIVGVKDGIPTVKFARRVKKTSNFVWPQETDETEVQDRDIVVFLPNPEIGRRGGMTFPLSFSGFNVF